MVTGIGMATGTGDQDRRQDRQRRSEAVPGAGADRAAARAQAGPASAFATAAISHSDSLAYDPEAAAHLTAARRTGSCLAGKGLQERKPTNAPSGRCGASHRRQGARGNAVGKCAFIQCGQLSLLSTSPWQARAGGSAAGWAVPGWGRARTRACRARGAFPAPSLCAPEQPGRAGGPAGGRSSRQRAGPPCASSWQGTEEPCPALPCSGASGAGGIPPAAAALPAQLVAAGMEQLRASPRSGHELDLSARHGSSAEFPSVPVERGRGAVFGAAVLGCGGWVSPFPAGEPRGEPWRG
ncbi:uncharacterized protein LOC126639434 [Myiozetetes cayanensis]|uniref:uncharacterized protein LOC126639434 n=1 Tax=Myiozetetes cayanensis TaxID=478635 RepID=UPI00215F2D40|nr:uncharacterized protein LOC126639434 [Myiozetetes cayanensis]